MHKVQGDYIRARHAYLAAQAAAIAEEPEFDYKDCTPAELDEFVEVCSAVSQKYHCEKLRREMTQARDRMFDWAKAKIAAGCSTKPKIATALSVFDDVFKHPTQLYELIELVLTLRA